MHGLSKLAPVTAPIISDDYELNFFNCITGYMMHALSTSQSMGLLQVIPGEGKTVRTVMASRFPSIPAATTPTRLVSLQTIAYIQALGIHSLSYMMPSKTLAAKASVLNSNLVGDVESSVATEPDFTEDEFYNDFSKMLGYFYGDIVGLEGASGLRLDQPCRRRVSKGDEFNKAAPAPPAPAAPAPAAGENGARPADEPPTPPSSEGAEAGAGDPAPCKGAVQLPATSKPSCRRK